MRSFFALTILLLVSTAAYGHGVRKSPPVVFACTGSSPALSAPDTGNAVTNGANFQLCINAAVLGDTITLTAGATYNSPTAAEGFRFPNKGAGSTYINIVSSNPASRPTDLSTYPSLDPATGYPRRVTTAEAVGMPKLVGTDEGYPALFFNLSSHHYNLVGLEVTNATVIQYQVGLIRTGGGGQESVFSDFSHHLIFDYLYVHPWENASPTEDYEYGSVEKAFLLNGYDFTITHCAVQGFTGYSESNHALRLDTNAILIGSGTGDILIQNNLLESMANNIFTGGSGGMINPTHATTITGAVITQAGGSFTTTLASTTDLEVGDFFAIYNENINGRGNCNPAYQGGIVGCISPPSNAKITAINHGTGVVTASGGLRMNLGYRKNYINIFNSSGSYPAGMSGTFTLTWEGQTTGPITYSSTKATLMSNISTALIALSNVDAADFQMVDDPDWGVYVNFGEYSAIVGATCPSVDQFCGDTWAYPATMTEMTGNGAGLTGGTSPTLYVHWKGQEYGSGLRTEAGDEPDNGSEAWWEGYGLNNIQMKQNIIAKYDAWYQWQGAQKGYLEFKAGTNMLLDGNLFFWDGDDEPQGPGALVLTPHQDGGCTWCVITDLTVSNNWFQTGGFAGMQLQDAIWWGPISENIIFTNNLQTAPQTGSQPEFASAMSSGYMTMTHNTFLLGNTRFIQGYSAMDGDSGSATNIIRDNIVRAGTGLYCLIPLPAPGQADDCWPGSTSENRQNLLIDDQGWIGPFSNPFAEYWTQWADFWPTQFYNNSISNIKFVNAPATFGTKYGNYRLQADSPYHNAASDGTDVGVDFDAMAVAAGVNWFPTSASLGSVGVSGKVSVGGRVIIK